MKYDLGWFLTTFAPTVAVIGVLAYAFANVMGCAPPAKASGAYANSFSGPNGTTCYIVYDDGKAVGGNCL